jgi:molybdopterin synthase catalytic subunit
LSAVKVTVVYFARARECAGTSEEELELIQPASLQQLFSRMIALHPTLAEIKNTLSPLVNGKWMPQETELKDGDRVALLPPVGGG